MSESADFGKETDQTSAFSAKAPKRKFLRRPSALPEKPVREDKPLSEKQIEIGRWFSAYKKFSFPPELVHSTNRWWGWINSKITNIDKEDAHAASKDFGLTIDFGDPLQVIGALKYARTADTSNKLDKAKQAILRGCHPYIVEDMFRLTPKQLDALTKDVEVNHPNFEIDWGSV